MIRDAFLAFIALSAVVSLFDWRKGLYMLILVGALQDPVRKIVPGHPGYLALATVPAWFSIILGAFSTERGLWGSFRRAFPQLATAMGIFVLLLIPAAMRSATYGPGSWQLTIIGLFGYLSVLAAWVIGYGFPKREGDLVRLLTFYCLVTAVMLVGTPLESLKIGENWGVLGTSSLGYRWLRYRGSYIIYMIAGFYRSPDIMGWHAVLTVMLGLSLALGKSGIMRMVLLLVAAWGGGSVMLCGRRKMALMLPVFLAAFVWIHVRRRWKLPGAGIVGAVIVASALGYVLYEQMGPDSDIEEYYFLDTGDIMERIESHGWTALWATYCQFGFWGEGLGTAAQGIQHLQVARPRTWQEGGPGRLLVELGVPGFLGVVFLLVTLMKAVLRLVAQLERSEPHFYMFAGLAAIMLANAASFVVSHQVFGDPFINCLFALLIGALLSGERYTPEPDLHATPQ